MKVKGNHIYINHVFRKAELTIENGVIQSILCDDSIITDNDNYILPGFIDLHYHGCYGTNSMDETNEQLKHMMTNVLKEGTTSILATTTSDETNKIIKALQHLHAYAKTQTSEEAEIIGIHLEGPYLSKKRAGAQKSEYLKHTDIEEFRQFVDAAGGDLKRCTLAPEMDEDMALTNYASKEGIVVSLGHSDADETIAKEGFEKGATLVTHLFNGMREMMHREPNLACAGLMDERVYCEVTADGHHVAFDMLRLVWKLKGSEYLILITDSNMAKGLPAGIYDFNARKVQVDEDGVARLLATGSLAGSTAQLNLCLKNMVEQVGVPLEDAVRMVSENPAKCIGIEKHKGYIKEGYDADLSVLDKDFQVVAVYKKGKEVRFI